MKKIISTTEAPAAIGPYSQAVQHGELIFLSGQLPIDPSTGEMPEGIAAQTRQALQNVSAILAAAGSGMDKVLKVGIFLADIGDFAEMNEVYKGFFTEGSYPARSAFQVGCLPRNALVEIEVVAEAGGR